MSATDEMEERNLHEAYQRGFAEARKQERERIVKILESWNPFQTTFGEVMESLCKQHEGAPVTPQQEPEHCGHECVCRWCVDEEYCMHPDIPDCIPLPCPYDTRTSRPAPSPLEKVLLCFGNYWECPIDEEECEVSDPCHQKAIRDREHDEQVKREAREEVLEEVRDACIHDAIEARVFRTIQSLRSEVKKP